MPLFRILGYDTENPDEVKAEYVCDVGVKTSEKVDLAILIDDEVKMLVECKSAKTKLNSNHLNQLFRYYSVSDARIAILTNGVEYRFFTDSVKSGRMDSEPFLIVDVVIIVIIIDGSTILKFMKISVIIRPCCLGDFIYQFVICLIITYIIIITHYYKYNYFIICVNILKN